MNAKVGWIGTGRMGFPLVERLLAAGVEVAVYNRTRAKAQPLTEKGATLVESPADLADRAIVFTMIDSDGALLDVATGPAGVLSRAGAGAGGAGGRIHGVTRGLGGRAAGSGGGGLRLAGGAGERQSGGRALGRSGGRGLGPGGGV